MEEREEGDSRFLKVEVVVEEDEFKVVSAEVTNNGVDSAISTVKELDEKGKDVRESYGDKAGIRGVQYIRDTLI
ncbi:hypothetical protein IC006_2451 [Sulfuracidifex tepidarius]|uniref:Uncharacterized protein n=1 Tax=Sulfuracidifex tepidarius TaxID=1294262 RepID=A0A510DY08_9CREN|nr:hypothetical protein IC006_2451 [Sulfuracidifex tepidarius]BBG27898.1 hypothetical protein IC007_2453 [Sulfuracidifex tepidarius]